MRNAALIVVVASLWSFSCRVAPAGAVEPAAGGATTPLPEVMVEADRQVLQRHVLQFVSRITQQPKYDGPLTRWISPVCPWVGGMPTSAQELFLNRLSEVIQDIHVPVAEEHCKPNLLVVVTQQPADLIKQWTARDPGLFYELSRAQQSHLENGLAPVRVVYTHAALDADGHPPSSQSASRHGHLEWNVGRDFSTVIVVIDPKRLAGLPLVALADYVSIVGLAEINLEADLDNAPSILALFAQPAEQRPTALTTWDRGFLKALYSTAQASKLQRELIADEITTRVVLQRGYKNEQ